jgi:DNA replication and repair protein RecF
MEATFSGGVNLITGPNGHGKSNLLEAVHFLCLAHSHRTRKEKELCAFGQPRFVLRAEGKSENGPSDEDPSPRNQQLAVETGDGTKRVRVNGVEGKRLSDLIGPFPLVAFTPEDLELLRGGPGERRRFLDLLLCQRDPEAMSLLRRYGHALKQRNAALRMSGSGRGNRNVTLDEGLFAAFEQTLADAGAEIFLRRRRLLGELSPWAVDHYAQVGEDGETLDMRLGRGEEPTEIQAWKELLTEKLAESRLTDRETGTTSVGPHREDLHLQLRGKAVREFGSQGQKRSVALALKLAAADLLEKALGRPPLLLLDDVFAELDARRRSLFGERVKRKGQVFIASPERSEIPFGCDSVLALREGKLVL